MAKPPRDRASARTNTYFVTTRAFEGQALFQSERAAKLLIATILVYREQERYLLHEFVVMPIIYTSCSRLSPQLRLSERCSS